MKLIQKIILIALPAALVLSVLFCCIAIVLLAALPCSMVVVLIYMITHRGALPTFSKATTTNQTPKKKLPNFDIKNFLNEFNEQESNIMGQQAI